MMTPRQLKDYASYVILDHARQADRREIHDGYADYIGVEGAEISDEDARAVHNLIIRADITVSWPEDGSAQVSNVVAGAVHGTVIQTRDSGPISLGGVA